jgi:vitamin B12 transporter
LSKHVTILGLTAILAASPVLGAVAPAADDATIVVIGSGIEQPRSEVGQAITVITRNEIDRRQSVVISDLLATTPGVTVSRTGGVGNLTAVRIRGAEDGHTLTLVDGVRVNDPSSTSGAFDFGSLLSGNIDRIEVLRGPNSVIWGSQAIGGVVDIRTEEPGEKLAVNGRAEYGYSDQAELVGNVSGKMGPVSASVGAGYFRTDGISQFAAGTERDGYERFGANAKFKVAVSEAIELDLRGYYAESERDNDGGFPLRDSLDRSDVRELTGYAGVNMSLLDGRFRNRIAFTYSDLDRELSNPTAITFDAKGRSERFEYQGSFDIAEPLTLVFGAETETTRMRSISISSFGTTRTRGRANIDAFHAQAIAQPFAGLTVSGGARYSDHDSFGGKTTLGANFAYTPNGGKTVLRGTYAEGFKAPTLYQLQSEFGNLNLDPETAKSGDIGIEQRLLDGQVVASLTWFKRKIRNQIDFVSCFGNTAPICTGNTSGGIYDNIQRTRADGVEFGLGLHPVEGFDVVAQYTFIDAENRSPGDVNFGKDLARRPRQTVSVAADYRFPIGLSLGGTILHVGDSFDNASNSRRLDGYVLVDIRAAYPLTDKIELYGRVENLFDEEYRTVFNYGTIGRAAYGGVRFAF